ncbi:MAG TPA: nucleotide sugar dehydrogenase [Candidatus Nanopelagicaceae bacterium]
MKITVVALGKIGLPLAVQFARKGHTVFGADVNETTVNLVNDGIEPFPGEAHLAQYLAEVVESGGLTATTDTTWAVAQSDAVVVVVPLFVDEAGVPDFGWMDAATKAIGNGLKPGTLVSYETTLPVGTTRTRFAPMLEELSGLSAGVDFHLVFSPERVFTGRVFADLRKYPKLVGGIDTASGARGVKFYEDVLDFDPRPDLNRPNGVWDLGSCEASELAKLAETTYRDVNIALANQFALFSESHGIDVQKVIDASNSQPFSHIHRPGIAVGGHCIPIYPRFYLWNDPAATVVSAARSANAAMPAHVVGTLAKIHGDLKDQRVVVLGAAYRGGVKETAFSGVFPTVSALKEAGAKVVVHDPMYTDIELTQYGFDPYHYGESIDAAIVQADHSEYRDLTSAQLPGVRTILDGRGVTDENNWKGVRYHVVGRAL